MFYYLKKEALLGLCFGALLCLIATTATEALAGEPQISAGRAHSLTLDVYGAASAWGDSLEGQGVAPVPPTGYVRIAAGSDHNLAIKTDGTVAEWGLDVTAPPPSGFGLPLPTAKPTPLTGVVDVAGGAFFSAALLDTYTVVAWGDNSAGQTNVPATLTGVSAIAAGDAHILALKSDGAVVGWGDDIFSQATGGAAFTGIVAVAAGSAHSLALKSDGTVVGWGDNTNGQITIPSGLTGVTAIAANSQYSMALKSDGTVVVWGISTGLVNINVVPTALTNAATANVVAIAAGGSHAMALKSDGTVVAWGDDFAGQIAGATGVNLGVVAAPADTTPPVITLNGTTPVIHSVSTPYIDAGATVTDNVDTTITNLVGVSTVVDSAVGNYTVTYDHSDAAGNAAVQKVRTVNVVDQVPPVITINGSNPATTEGGYAYIDAGATVTDNVDATITNLAGVSNVNIGAVGSFTVTYNHIDAAANAAVQKVRTVNVVDTTAPFIIEPLVDIYAEATAQATPVTLISPASLDISAVTFTQDAPVAGFPLGSTAVTWTATDAYSNVSTATQNVVISDTIAPVINGGVVLADVYAAVTNTNGQADAYTAVSLVAPSATDIFGAAVSSNAPAAGFPLGTTVVIWTADDGNGNASTASQNVIVQDTTAPVITLTGAVDVYVEVGTAYSDLGATATDNVDTNVTVSNDAYTAVNSSVIGTYIITYQALDSAGNAAVNVTRNVHVRDTTAPVITLNTGIGKLKAQSIAAGHTHSLALKTDGTVVAWGDNTKGQISVPTGLSGVTAIAAGDYHGLVLKTDGTVVQWGHTSFGQGTVPAGLSGVTAIAAGAYHSLALKNDGTVVAWGNNSYGQITVPAGLTNVTAIAAGNNHNLALKTDGTVVQWGDTSFGQGTVPAGLTGVTAIAAAGYHSLALKTDGTVVQWGDTSFGQGTVPTGLTGVTAIAARSYHNLALKNDGSVVAWGRNVEGQATVPAGLTGVTTIAAGGLHNLALKTDGTVVAWGRNVEGQTNVPADAVVNLTLEAGQSYTNPGATATDNVDSIVIVGNDATTVVDVNTVGTYVVTYTATDAAGNTATGTRTVTVEDTTAPVITLNGTTPVIHGVGTAYIDAGATVTDNVDATITNLVGVGTVNTSVVGSYTITYNYTDASGIAAAPVVRTVNVVDQTPPVITINGSNPATTEGGFAYTDAGATVTDNVDATITNLTGVSNVNTGAVGSYTVTYNHTDAAANTALPKVRTVNVVDTTAPVITLTGEVDVYVEVGTAYIDLGATATDNVDTSVTVSNDANTTVNTNVVGAYIVTYQASDSAGNAAVNVMRNVHVRDTTAPIIVPNPVGSSASYTVFNGIVYVPLNTPYIDTYATVTDNVDATISNLVGTSTVNEAIVGLYTVTYDYSDAAGNAAVQVVRQVVVFDATPPVITLTGAVDVYVEVGTAYIDPGATATDNVDTNVTVSSDANTVVNVNAIGTYVVTYTSTDNMGNKATATRNVHVRDTTTPVITLTGAVDVYVEAGTAYSDLGATATDNVDTNVTVSNDAYTAVNSSVIGTYIVTYQASDSAGNAAVNVTRNVHVRDTTAPVITLNTSIVKLKAIAAGIGHSLALKNDGTVVAWGDNTKGQISVPTGLSGVKAIAAGEYHSLAIKTDGTVVAWGQDAGGQGTVPAGLSGVTAIAAGTSHSLALKNDGTVVAWGDNTKGQISVPTGLTGVKAIAAGAYHNLALKNDGTVVAWGYNSLGQATIPTGLTGVKAIAAAGYHSLALKNDGTVVAWGSSSKGQTNVPAGLTNVAAIAAGAYHNLALKNDGTVVQWGDTTLFQGTVPAGLSGVTAIAAGGYHNLALKNDGTVVAWGYNFLGQTNVPTETVVNPTLEVGQSYTELGATATDNVDYIVIVGNDATTAVDVNTVGTYVVTYTATDAAGNTATVTRTVTVEDTTAPVITLNGTTPVIHGVGTAYIDAGATVTDNVDVNVTVSNDADTVVNTNVVGTYVITYTATDAAGNTATVTRTVTVEDTTAPVIRLNLPTDPYQIPAGIDTVEVALGAAYIDAYATVTDNVDATISNLAGVGTVNTSAVGSYTITYNHSDAAGNAAAPVVRTVNVVDRSVDTTPPVISLNTTTARIQQIAAGFVHSLALKNDGTVVAWGYNKDGQTTVPAGLTGVKAIAAGGKHSLAIKTDGTVVAWGRSAEGQATVPAGLTEVKAIAAGLSHSLALKTDGSVVAWGYNKEGQTTVPAGLTGVKAIAAGASHNLALKTDGTVVAWGYNSSGQTNVPTSLTGVKAIAAGNDHSLALKNDGTVVAWGNNKDGQTTVPAGLTGVTAIAAGEYHSLAIKTDGTVVAWGQDAGGQNTIPTGLTGVKALTAGFQHNLALKLDGTVVAWGFIYSTVNFGQANVPEFTVTDFTLEVGQSYTDPGATVIDNKDGTISTNLKGAGKVDTSKVGVYKVTYNAKDAAGNAASEVVRTVTVKAAAASSSGTCSNVVPMLNMNLLPMYALMLLGMLGLSRRCKT